MLDKNDRKYIIRRIITYLAIAMIMFFISSCQARALENYSLVWDTVICPGGQGNNSGEWKGCSNSTDNYFRFKNNGDIPEGYYDVSFTIQSSIGQNIAVQMKDVSCQVNGTDVARIGQDTYSTSGLFYTVKCDGVPITNGINQLYIKSYSLSNLQTQVLIYNRLTPHGSDTSAIQSGIQDVNNSINDSTPPSNNEITGNTSDWSSYNASNGVINDLVLMPVTLLNSFVNGMNNTCSSYDLGELWGEHIILPCIDLSQILGSVWTIIDIILSGVFIFVFGKQCVKIFNDFTNLRSGQIDTLYGGGN